MKTYLKIKIMSLAEEAKIIRREERKWPGTHAIRTGLHLHRVHDVRKESRVACLAYGFLRGRSYRALEGKSYSEPDWSRVERLVEKYGHMDIREVKQKISEWKAAPAAL